MASAVTCEATGEKGLNKDDRSTFKQQRRGREGGKKENSKILQNQQHKILVQGLIKHSSTRDFHVINTQSCN